MNRSSSGAGNIPGKGSGTCTEALHWFAAYLVSAPLVLVNCMAHWISQTVLVLLQEKDSRKWSGKQGFGQSILSVMLKGMENHHRHQSREVTTSDGHLFEYLLSWDHSPSPPTSLGTQEKRKTASKICSGKTQSQRLSHTRSYRIFT